MSAPQGNTNNNNGNNSGLRSGYYKECDRSEHDHHNDEQQEPSSASTATPDPRKGPPIVLDHANMRVPLASEDPPSGDSPSSDKSTPPDRKRENEEMTKHNINPLTIGTFQGTRQKDVPPLEPGTRTSSPTKKGSPQKKQNDPENVMTAYPPGHHEGNWPPRDPARVRRDSQSPPPSPSSPAPGEVDNEAEGSSSLGSAVTEDQATSVSSGESDKTGDDTSPERLPSDSSFSEHGTSSSSEKGKETEGDEDPESPSVRKRVPKQSDGLSEGLERLSLTGPQVKADEEG